MNPITLDTEESQECHRILDWLASTLYRSDPCLGCGAEWPYRANAYASHRWDCMVKRSLYLIEKWADA